MEQLKSWKLPHLCFTQKACAHSEAPSPGWACLMWYATGYGGGSPHSSQMVSFSGLPTASWAISPNRLPLGRTSVFFFFFSFAFLPLFSHSLLRTAQEPGLGKIIFWDAALIVAKEMSLPRKPPGAAASRGAVTSTSPCGAWTSQKWPPAFPLSHFSAGVSSAWTTPYFCWCCPF